MLIINFQMSTGRIMTLSVESLNKLYFQFLQQHVLPLLSKPSPQIAQLLQKSSAYEAHRFLQDLFSPIQTPLAPLNGSLNNLSQPPLPNNNPYSYALSSSCEQPKPTFNDHHKSLENGLEKKGDEKRNGNNKLGMRKALTGTNFEERSKQFKFSQPEDKITPVVSLTHSVGNDSLIPIPSLGAPSLSSDFKGEYEIRGDKLSGGSHSQSEKRSKAQTMRECVTKINKVFNDNHSKIEKYSKKVDSQNKLFNLNVSTKIERSGEGNRMLDYQFHMKDINVRKY